MRKAKQAPAGYPEYKQLDLPATDRAINKQWETGKVFSRSISERPAGKPYVFYEGPPSANGLPGIHHVMSRTLKDLFCRYKTMQGYRVERKGGWDTHGLPVELGVEKKLGITKEDIGEQVSVAEYNAICRKEVMKYKESWEKLTRQMGFWIDLDDPYVTFENGYIETLWCLLKQLYEKDYLYKGYTIQPYSPAAGTGLSSHELNLPGCYRDIKDTTVTALFPILEDEASKDLLKDRKGDIPVSLLAWTTTPWTLPSNAALAVGAGITYVRVLTENKYTGKPVYVVCAEALLDKIVPEAERQDEPLRLKGSKLEGIRYAPLFDFEVLKHYQDRPNVYRVITGDFVTTEEGTGIVHIAPTFGADDQRVGQQQGIAPITVTHPETGNPMPLVDKQGRFVEGTHDAKDDFSGRFVRKEYHPDDEVEDLNISLAVNLKKAGRAFKLEKYVHSYPHCWRTDKPLLYYPLDSWFIKTTAVKDRLIELNKQINWQPPFTGTGRFGHWLENLVDWNLSRSRFWGTPLPIWCTEDGKQRKCIGSIKELRQEVEKAVKAGVMDKPLPNEIDLHRPYVDDIILVSHDGLPMHREPDLIDVWFDSGAMPYAQWHYPFENTSTFKSNFPADFIAEGVDQTRGWFFTLHVLGVLLFDSVAYKNVVANGLVLDKEGNKMSKRLGNVVDPFKTIEKYGADATRWYLMSNAQPWDNIKFDLKGIEAVQRKFFGTLFNTYSFFALYANIDGFCYSEKEVPVSQRPELDRWIISLLNTLIAEVRHHYDEYDPTRATRTIQAFVTDHLSNWYVRLSRRKFWKGAYEKEKIAAYQTLYTCLETVAHLIAPVAPFYADRLFNDLNAVSRRRKAVSVHRSEMPLPDKKVINKDLEERMDLAQKVSSMVLFLRKKEQIKVRQPLQKILIPVLNPKMEEQLKVVEPLIRSEVNVKEVEYVSGAAGVIKKQVKPKFEVLGPRLGPKMGKVKQALEHCSQEDIYRFEQEGSYELKVDDDTVKLSLDEVELTSEDIPGWLSAHEHGLTVALDITITDALRDEGAAREFVNRIQKVRKEQDFDVTDRIHIEVEKKPWLTSALTRYFDYICRETLAHDLKQVDRLQNATSVDVNGKKVAVKVERVGQVHSA